MMEPRVLSPVMSYTASQSTVNTVRSPGNSNVMVFFTYLPKGVMLQEEGNILVKDYYIAAPGCIVITYMFLCLLI